MSCIIILLLISQESSDPTWGQYYVNDFGAKSSGFGGSPTAWDGDIEYASWNPSAINNIEGLTFIGSLTYTSGSVNINYTSDIDHYDTSEPLPGILGIGFPLNKKIFLGFSLNIPYRHCYKTGWIPDEEDSLRVSITRRFYAFNPIIGYKINEKFQIGFNFAIISRKENTLLYATSTNAFAYNYSFTRYGIEPNLGIHYKTNKIVTLGIFIKKGLVQGKEHWPSEEIYSIKESTPMIISFGAKFIPSPKLTFTWSVDYIQWKGVNFSIDGNNQRIYNIKDVIRMHLGAEYKTKSKLAFRFGISENPYKSSNPSLKRDQTFLYGGLGIKTNKLNIDFAVSSSKILNSKNMQTTNCLFSITYSTKKANHKIQNRQDDLIFPHRQSKSTNTNYYK